MIQREILKLENLFDGIKTMKKLPEAIFAVDVNHDKIAVKEAKKMGIKVVGLVDTNSDIEDINYPVPSNDDAIKAIALMTHIFAEGINEGKSQPLEETVSNSNQTQKERANE